MGHAVMIFSFQLQKTRWCKSVKYFHSRVALCEEIRDRELICTLCNEKLNTVYMTQIILFLGKLEKLQGKNIYHLYKMQCN